MSMETFKSPRGRVLRAYGDLTLLTMDRMTVFGDRIDSDPRIVSLSLTPSPNTAGSWLRSTMPAGAVIVIAQDACDLVGEPSDESAEAIQQWCASAAERGLWHDWYLTNHKDVLKAAPLLTPAEMDSRENNDPSSAHFYSKNEARKAGGKLRIAIDVTWLGPYETGAQVLTTAAINALAQDDRVGEIILIGLAELPGYAEFLNTYSHVRMTDSSDQSLPADIVWYPNQIDGRSNIADARLLGRRVVTTYLDLIAYDIPRYHGSSEGWAAYRSLQRKIALSVDGVTTISADVADQLQHEVPLLEEHRVQALPLGLDHITVAQAPEQPDEDLADVVKALAGKRFITVLGNDFVHKNRDFAIAVWQEVLRNGESCDLVLAGLHVKSSSSKEQESALLKKHTDLRGSVHSVGHVSSASRAWLLKNASAVLYPSSAEGFGFVPYEAAALGTPSTFTNFGPLKEIAQLKDLPKTWSIEAHAADVIRLLNDEAAANERVVALGEAIRFYTWQRFADGLVEFFQRIAKEAPIASSAVAGSNDAAALAAVLGSRSYRALEPARKLAGKLKRK
jgi:glycosyltransferase involved in cell wall biosynthesis